MDILIVDDEPLARQRLSKLASELGHEVISEAANGQEALNAIENHDPSIVLLDIEMPGENGLEIAKKISQFEAPPAIIFTTAYDQYAIKAFETLAAGYLLKPIEKIKLAAVLDKAKTLNKLQISEIKRQNNNQQDKKRKHITVNGHKGVKLIAIEDIRCFIADQKYVRVISTHGEVIIDETLKELESSLTDSFTRIHRNALISINHIKALGRDQSGQFSIQLESIDEQPIVSRRYTSKIKQLLKEL